MQLPRQTWLVGPRLYGVQAKLTLGHICAFRGKHTLLSTPSSASACLFFVGRKQKRQTKTRTTKQRHYSRLQLAASNKQDPIRMNTIPSLSL